MARGRKKEPTPVSPLKAKLRELDRLVATKGSDQTQIEQLGGELLETYPNDSDVLNICMRGIPSLSQKAYGQLMLSRLNLEGIDTIPYIINWQEEYYEDAWARLVAFLEANGSEIYARVLGRFASEVEGFSQRAMELLEKKVPTLSHEELLAFVAGRVGYTHRTIVVNFGKGNEHITRVKTLVALRLLKEEVKGIGASGVLLPMMFLPGARQQAAEWLFSVRFTWCDCKNVVRFVPEKRRDAWEFALRHNAVSVEIWSEFVERFEISEPCKSEVLDHHSPEDWDHLWTVFERLEPNNRELSDVALKSRKFAHKATKKLVEKRDLENLKVILTRGASRASRTEAGQFFLANNPDEEILASIIYNAPSLRREAAQKLLDLPPVISDAA